MIIARDEEGEVMEFKNVPGVLRHINSRGSSEFTRYDRSDWRDGLVNWFGYTLLSVHGRKVKGEAVQ